MFTVHHVFETVHSVILLGQVCAQQLRDTRRKIKKLGTRFTLLTMSERLHETLCLRLTTEHKGIYFKKEI